MPSPAPHFEQIHVPLPSRLSQRQRSLPPHKGHGPCLPVRNDSPMPSAGRIPDQRPLARSLSGSLLSMMLLAPHPCDLTGFDPRQYFRRGIHGWNIFEAIRPNIEFLAKLVGGPSTRGASCLRIPPQLRIPWSCRPSCVQHLLPSICLFSV
jgi:hypothetical protein